MLQLSVDEFVNLCTHSKITELMSPEAKPFHYTELFPVHVMEPPPPLKKKTRL